MKTNTHSRYAAARRWLIFWTLFIGLGALGGSLGMLLDPTGKSMGMDAMLPFFKKLPFADILFQDFTFSGIALLLVNGLPNLLAAGLLLGRKPQGTVLGGVLGITLMLWICIQFYMFPPNFMDTAYFLFGLAQALTGYAAWVFARQEAFAAEQRTYPHVGQDPERLVVYFSRMGYTKKAAMEEAERTGAQVLELQAKEPTAGTKGFWWCGRWGMHRWAMDIQPIPENLSQYAHVTLCAPIWVFNLCGPMRTFCREVRGKLREADYILLHHTRSSYKNAAREMDSLLGLHGTGLKSICCRKGRFMEIKTFTDKEF